MFAVIILTTQMRNHEDRQAAWNFIHIVAEGIRYGSYLSEMFEVSRRTINRDIEDLIGVEVLPIAELFAGDYACLDFRENKETPTVCVWSHDNSEELAPVTYKAADSFSEFIDMPKG